MVQVLVNISQKFVAEKKRGLCKSYSYEKKELRKMDKCSRDLKQWVFRCLPKKRGKKDE